MSAQKASPTRNDLLTDEDYNLLPGTQQLILEVMAARTRLGESWWAFDRKFKVQAHALEDKGWVSTKSGIAQDTFLARLTTAAERVVLDPAYVAPSPSPTDEDAHALRVGRAVLALREVLG